MRATRKFIAEKFKIFNTEIFGGELPEIPLVLTNAGRAMGMVRYQTRSRFGGKKEIFNLRLQISTRYDMPQPELEDILIHEMIHLYIISKGLRDTSSHGTLFRKLMSDINARHGRNVTISHKSDKETLATDETLHRHYICETHWKKGERFITCVARTQIFDINEVYTRHPECTSVKWWYSTDPFFNRYPRSRSPKLYKISDEDYDRHILTASMECICDGQVFKPV